MSQKEEKSDFSINGHSCHGRKLFLASIAFNIFLVGMATSSFLRPFGMMPPPMPFGPPGFGPGESIAASLPAADAAKLRAIYADAHKRMLVDHDEVEKTTLAIAALLREDNPDKAALQASIDKLQALGKDFHGDMADVLMRIATEIPVESRKIIADRIAEGRLTFDMHERPRPPFAGLPPDPNGGPFGQGGNRSAMPMMDAPPQDAPKK
jgi:Spy/CpxP family protein refolding chaperone